jgi:hypothetical protein
MQQAGVDANHEGRARDHACDLIERLMLRHACMRNRSRDGIAAPPFGFSAPGKHQGIAALR